MTKVTGLQSPTLTSLSAMSTTLCENDIGTVGHSKPRSTHDCNPQADLFGERLHEDNLAKIILKSRVPTLSILWNGQ